MSSARRLRRSRNLTPEVTVTHAWRGDKPAVVTHATFDDLAHYGAEMFDALKAGYEAGLSGVAILVIHRMSDYAKRLGLDGHPHPFVIQAVGWDKAVELEPTLAPGGPPKLPTAAVILATGDRFEANLASYQSPDGLKLAWTYSAEFRAFAREKMADAVPALIKATGVDGP
jgi:hypothetical protein